MSPDSELFPFVLLAGFLAVALAATRVGAVVGRRLRDVKVEHGLVEEESESSLVTVASALESIESRLRSDVEAVQRHVTTRLEDRLDQVESRLVTASTAQAAATTELTGVVSNLAGRVATIVESPMPQAPEFLGSPMYVAADPLSAFLETGREILRVRPSGQARRDDLVRFLRERYEIDDPEVVRDLVWLARALRAPAAMDLAAATGLAVGVGAPGGAAGVAAALTAFQALKVPAPSDWEQLLGR